MPYLWLGIRTYPLDGWCIPSPPPGAESSPMHRCERSEGAGCLQGGICQGRGCAHDCQHGALSRNPEGVAQPEGAGSTAGHHFHKIPLPYSGSVVPLSGRRFSGCGYRGRGCPGAQAFARRTAGSSGPTEGGGR